MAGLLTLASCSDFLNETSQDEVLVKDANDYSELLMGSGYPSPTEKLYTPLYLMDDDYMLNENAMSDDEDYSSALSAYPFHTWQPDMWQNANVDQSYYGDMYYKSYQRIMGVNAVLDGIDQANGDIKTKETVKAEALALRGYYYYMLVNIFGKPYNDDSKAPGVPLKLTANLQTNGTPRSTVGEVYSQIVNDLTSAREILSRYPKTRGDFRINLPSVDILLTRVYLQMEDWDNVVKVATDAIENGNPLTNYLNLPAKAKTFSTYDYSEVEWLYGNGYSTCSLPGIRPSSDLWDKFADNDTRKKLWFTASGKNVNLQKKKLASKRTPTNAIRMSEAWLARAEAYAMKDQLANATADLDHLRENRYNNYSPAVYNDRSQLLDEVRKERRLELCYDEVRWFDLRRYGMPSISHKYKARKSAVWVTYTLSAKDPLYTLPIPNADIQQNSKLEQNESAKAPARQGI